MSKIRNSIQKRKDVGYFSVNNQLLLDVIWYGEQEFKVKIVKIRSINVQNWKINHNFAIIPVNAIGRREKHDKTMYDLRSEG